MGRELSQGWPGNPGQWMVFGHNDAPVPAITRQQDVVAEQLARAGSRNGATLYISTPGTLAVAANFT